MQKKDDLIEVLEIFFEVLAVILIGAMVAGKIAKGPALEVMKVTPEPTLTVTPTAVPIPTNTPTVTPSPTQLPTPTVRASIPKSCTIKAVAAGHTFKPYTRYTAYDVKGSAQYKLQKVAWTETRTGIRIVTDPEGVDRYCVALGTYWAGAHPEHIGRCVDVLMVNGHLLHCVLADVKKTEDTKNRQNRYGEINNDVLEFIVDMKVLSKAVKECGNCSKISEEFEGDVREMIVYDMWIEGFGGKQ